MADDNYFMGLDGFVWFTGVVEDRNDPAKLGRVRVRCLGLHTEDKNEIPTDALPWAHIMHPVHDPSMQGMGTTPSFLVEGTWVIGFFRDVQDKQQPIIMGTLPGYSQLPDDIGDDTSVEAIKQYRENDDKGFTDPNKKYPQYPNEKSGHNLGESDVNRLARGDDNYVHRILEQKQLFANNYSNVPSSTSSFAMPHSTTNTQYPFNHVFESESGHIREFDDTYGSERIHEYHRSGTFYEIDGGGNKVIHVVGDNYRFVAGSDFINVQGDVNITVDGNCNTVVKEDFNIKCKNLNIEVEEDFDTFVKGNTTQQYGEGADSIFKTTALGAVSQRYNTTLDTVIIGNATHTHTGEMSSSISGAVTERYGSTIDRSILGVQTDVHAAAYTINSTAGGVNINSVGEVKLFSTELDFKASSGITLDASDVNINSGGSTDLAARKGDTADQGDGGGGHADGSNEIETGSATVKIGSADPGIGEPSVEASELKLVKEVVDVPVEERVKKQGSARTENAGTGGYNPNIDGDNPIVAIPLRRTDNVVNSELENLGVDPVGMSTGEAREVLKIYTQTVSDVDPTIDPASEEGKQLNIVASSGSEEAADPSSHEHGEDLPPETATVNDTVHNQYRSYLGISTEGKVFGDVFKDSEITDDVRERYSNKFFPMDYRLAQLRGRPRLTITNSSNTLFSGTKPKVLGIAEKVAFDLGKQLEINSAFRTKERHLEIYRRIGKKAPKNSQHLSGQALDVQMRNFSTAERVEFMRLMIKYEILTFGWYFSSGNTFIHVDVRDHVVNWNRPPSAYKSTLISSGGLVGKYWNAYYA